MSFFSKFSLFVKVIMCVLIVLMITIVGSWLFLPTYLKNTIEKNDIDWFGREVSIENIKFNPFLLSVVLNNVSVKEENKDANFFSFQSLLADFSVSSIFKKAIITDRIELNSLDGNVIQNGKQFNFSGMFAGDDKEDETKSDDNAIYFELNNVKVNNAKITYKDQLLHSKVTLDSVFINEKVFRKNDSIFDADVLFKQNEGGALEGNILYNLKNDNYKINTQVEDWNLNPYQPYVTSVIKLSEFGGLLTADLSVNGNAGNSDFLQGTGSFNISEFSMVDPEEKHLMDVGSISVNVNDLNTTKNIYDFDKILIENTNINFEYLPKGDNFTKWLVTASGTNVDESHDTSNYYVSPFEMLSVYIYDMTKEYIFKSYTAEEIRFSNFNLKFYDYTLEDPFFMDLSNVDIEALDIRPENQFANFNVDGAINKTGKIKGLVAVSRQGVENMKVDMNIKGLFLNRFSPYGRFYTAHEFLEGVSSFTNKSVIENSFLKSENSLFIEGISVGKKNKTRTGNSLPMRLAVALMKDVNGNIDLNIPVEGPINDPEYKFGKVIWQVIKNIFTKAVSSPIRAIGNVLKISEDDIENIYFDSGQVLLSPKQKKSLNDIAKILSRKKELIITLEHLYNKEYEYDTNALKGAKLKYLKQSDITIKEGIPIGKQAYDIPNTDPKFIEYLKQVTPNFDDSISIPENARRLLGKEYVEAELLKVKETQKQLITNYLVAEKQIAAERFKIIDGSDNKEALNQSRPKFKVKFDVL